jgi:5-methylcytosine-specific restriction endonuclease McrA
MTRKHSTVLRRVGTQHIRGMLKTSIRQQRRETVYALTFKKLGRVPCFVCGDHVPQDGATLEHITPRSKGGTDDMSNLAISHARCNHSRGNACS